MRLILGPGRQSVNLDKDGEPGRASQTQQELGRAGHVGRELDAGSEAVGGLGIRDYAMPTQGRHAQGQGARTGAAGL